MYSAFCISFPQSWKQFDDVTFKEMLSRDVSMCLSGFPPHLRKYLKWKKKLLEPSNMREGTAFQEDKQSQFKK